MSPIVKYTLGRLGIFLAILLALWPVHIDIFLRLILAFAFSAAISFLLLRLWRDQMAQRLAEMADRRRTQKERLRTALAGEDRAEPRAGAEPPAENDGRS